LECKVLTCLVKIVAAANRDKHVLVVDDDIELALQFQELLEVHGYRVSTVADGGEALKLVLQDNVDAIVCDLSMPELPGDLFYREIGRARPQLLRRFIFLTGNVDNPLYETFLKNVSAPVLPKPASMDRLLEKLAAVLAV
jgi:two-component system C4-dicarboxylate transport response regulator DctD